MGVTIGEAEIRHDHELAINPGQVFGKLDGVATKDPAFGLDAVWIKQEQREHAQSLWVRVALIDCKSHSPVSYSHSLVSVCSIENHLRVDL